jgi:hypothetical protein
MTSSVLDRPPMTLLPIASIMPSEYQTTLSRNGGNPYSKPVVLFLLPAQEDPFITEMVDQLRKNIPPTVEYAFARIAQNHQIGISIARYSPWIVVTTGDDWLHRFIPPMEGLPIQTSKDLHGLWQPVYWENGHRLVVYPLEDLPLRRRRRLSGDKTLSPSTQGFSDSPPRRFTSLMNTSPTSSPRGSPPVYVSRSSSPLSSQQPDEAPEVWSSVPNDLQKLTAALSCMRPPGWAIPSA